MERVVKLIDERIKELKEKKKQLLFDSNIRSVDNMIIELLTLRTEITFLQATDLLEKAQKEHK